MFDRITAAGRVAWGLLGLSAALAVLFWIGWQFRIVLPPLVLAGAIVFILNPIVTLMQRRGMPRAGGTALSYLAVVGLLVLVGFLVAPLVQDQAEELSDEWPDIRDKAEEQWDEWAASSQEDGWVIEIPTIEELRDQFGGTTTAEAEEFDRVTTRAADVLEENDQSRLAADLDQVAAGVRGQLDDEGGFAEQLGTIREVGTRVFEIGLIFVLAPIIAFYLLVDLPHIGRIMRSLIPESAAPQVLHVAHRLNHTIGGYFRGQLAVAFIVGTMVSIGLAILGLQFWIIVGMIAGLFNMIPLIGPWVGAVPGVAIALTTEDFGTALWVVAIMTAAQQIDNHFISPLVMQRTTSLHPAVVMLALLAGGALGGFFGLLLAVPLTASLKVIIGHLWRVYVLELPFEDVAAADAAGELGVEHHSGLAGVLEDYTEGEFDDHDPAGNGAVADVEDDEIDDPTEEPATADS